MKGTCGDCSGPTDSPDYHVCLDCIANVKGTIYLLHFDPPYKWARHYMGWTRGSIWEELDLHRQGQGSPLVESAFYQGSRIIIARTWPNATREQERIFKNRKNNPKLCPVCTATSQK